MSASEATSGQMAWCDGADVPQHRLAIPPGDAGFVLGASVTEQLRTFHGRLFLPDDHGARLRRSLDAVGTDPGFAVPEILAAAQRIATHNHAAVARGGGADGDLGVVIFVTPGDLAAQHGGRPGRPRSVVHSFPLAFPLWADAYEAGVALRMVSVRQVPDACWPMHVKVRSRLHYHLADREAHAAEPGSRAVLSHLDGRISETSTANIAIVVAGSVVTPPSADALGGVSLAHTRRLAARLGIAWHERSLSTADLAAADEILLTSTPNCILPATRYDGRPVGTGGPGPVYRRLLDAWSADVGLDIVAQARHHAGRS
jgi:branched-chain amino acid aminotransferase